MEPELNNTPRDILARIKLFQKSKRSTIPNLPNLEKFFGDLNKKLEGLDRQLDYNVYMETVAENSKEVREKASSEELGMKRRLSFCQSSVK